MIWCLIFEKNQFQFKQEIWIQVIVILLQLYIYNLIAGTIGFMVFALFFGISITRKLSAVHRLVLDSGRSIIVWAVSMILGWQQFQILQIVGFVLMITGVLIFNNLLIGNNGNILLLKYMKNNSYYLSVLIKVLP